MQHLFIPVPAQRLISTLGSDGRESVEVVWFSLPPAMKITDPRNTLVSLSLLLAKDLGGVAASGTIVSGTTAPAYEVAILGRTTRFSQAYHVRLVLDGHRVYQLRIQSNDATSARAALHALAASFRLD
jgi:hypothetical protein